MAWHFRLIGAAGLAQPFRTYGGDTVLRIPKRNDDDEGLIAEIQDKVFDIYFEGDACPRGEREEFIRSRLRALSQ